MHIDVDVSSGLVHTVVGTAIDEADINVAGAAAINTDMAFPSST